MGGWVDENVLDFFMDKRYWTMNIHSCMKHNDPVVTVFTNLYLNLVILGIANHVLTALLYLPGLLVIVCYKCFCRKKKKKRGFGGRAPGIHKSLLLRL